MLEKGRGMDPIRAKWDSLMQIRPALMSIVGNAELIGGLIKYNDEHEKIFHFLTKRGSFSFNVVTRKLKSELQVV